MSADDAKRLARLAAWEAVFTAADFTVGAWAGGDVDRDGVISMPYFTYSAAVLRFVGEMYELGWVYSFDWMTWIGTEDGRRLSSSPDAIATASEADLAKVLTTMIRSDRFSEGALAAAFERGFVVAVAHRAGELARRP